MQVFYPNDSGQFSIAQGVSEKVQKSKTWRTKFFFKLHDISPYPWNVVLKVQIFMFVFL